MKRSLLLSALLLSAATLALPAYSIGSDNEDNLWELTNENDDFFQDGSFDFLTLPEEKNKKTNEPFIINNDQEGATFKSEVRHDVNYC